LSTNADDSNTEQSILNIQVIFSSSQQSNLSSLKVCNDTKCWSVLENENIGNNVASKNKRKVEALSINSDSDNLIDISSFVVDGIDNNIAKLKYVYNGESGELTLNNKLSFNPLSANNLYLRLDKELSVPFSSLSIENGKNGIFVPDEDFRKEFINGVILEVEKGSGDQMGHMYINKIGKTLDDYIEVNSYSIGFYDFKPFEVAIGVKNDFPKQFLKKIKVYVPINYSNISIHELKNKYTLIINGGKTPYDIVLQNNQRYISFFTLHSNFQMILESESVFLGE
jgi:hypothetical protein